MSKISKSEKKPIEQYDHKGKERCNNPPVGLVTPETDSDSSKKTYAYDPRTIIEAVRKRNGGQKQLSLFEYTGENPPLREAIEFYKHRHNWSNRMIAAESQMTFLNGMNYE